MIELFFCGDVFLANTTFNKRIGLGAKVSQLGKDKKIESLHSLAEKSDFVFCNLESPLTNDGEIVKNSSFIGSSNIPQLLTNSCVNIISIANNHILDHGVDKFEETIKILERNGMSFVGKYENGMSNICIFEKNNIKVGYAAFNGVDLHKINNPDLLAELNEKTVKLTLEKMSSLEVDIKVLSFHWGDEYITIPSPDQIKLGHFAIENGANIIVGHHPHVVQPIECYKDGLIMYSLGNCIFDFLQSKQFREGIVVKASINKLLKIEYKVIPILLQETGYFSFRVKHNHNNFAFDKLLDMYYKNEDKYSEYYYRRLKKNRFNERIRMKIHLFKVLFTPIYRNKVIIFKNCISTYLRVKQK